MVGGKNQNNISRHMHIPWKSNSSAHSFIGPQSCSFTEPAQKETVGNIDSLVWSLEKMIPRKKPAQLPLDLSLSCPLKLAASQYAFNRHLWNTSHWAGAESLSAREAGLCPPAAPRHEVRNLGRGRNKEGRNPKTSYRLVVWTFSLSCLDIQSQACLKHLAVKVQFISDDQVESDFFLNFFVC